MLGAPSLTNMNNALKLLACCAAVLAGCVTGSRSLPEFAALPSQPGLRSPLRQADQLSDPPEHLT